jgi:hypothetical protein
MTVRHLDPKVPEAVDRVIEDTIRELAGSEYIQAVRVRTSFDYSDDEGFSIEVVFHDEDWLPEISRLVPIVTTLCDRLCEIGEHRFPYVSYQYARPSGSRRRKDRKSR